MLKCTANYAAYGFENEPNGLSGWTVSVAVMNTFVNHACSKEDENASGYAGLDADDYGSEIMFSPLGYRRKFTYMTTVATRDITAGEEIQMNYAPFRTFMTEEYSNLLQNFCTNGDLSPLLQKMPRHCGTEESASQKALFETSNRDFLWYLVSAQALERISSKIDLVA